MIRRSMYSRNSFLSSTSSLSMTPFLTPSRTTTTRRTLGQAPAGAPRANVMSLATPPARQPSVVSDAGALSSNASTSGKPLPLDGDIDVADLTPSISHEGRHSNRLRAEVQGVRYSLPQQPPSKGSSSASAIPAASVAHGNLRRDSDITSSSHSSVADELIGFANLGNTCFMNSTLQCLLRCHRLRTFLLATDLESTAPRPTPLTSTLQDICRRMFSSSGAAARITSSSSSSTTTTGRAMAPSSFKSCLASYNKAFCGTDQHDAHEFLRFTLDAMHDECNTVTRKPVYEELKDIERESIRETAARWLANHVKRNSSVVQETFCGQFTSETVCQKCQHRSVSCETFLDLSLPIPRGASGTVRSDSDADFSIRKVITSSTATALHSATLQNALSEFFSPAVLSGDDAYHCPRCKARTEAKRTLGAFSLPEVLVIHLKRFRHSRFHANKINDPIGFPVEEVLDMAPYMHPESVQIQERTSQTYRLMGVVHHMGGVHSGHYIAHCRCNVRGNVSAPSTWYEFNDSSVDLVRGAPSSVAAATAYILFYERI